MTLYCVEGADCPYGLAIDEPEGVVHTPAHSNAQGRFAGLCFRCLADLRA